VIVQFLDRETARIDALIERKERLIALLEEKRQAIISHAVTRGLDPTAPLAASSWPWLDQHPNHWSVVAIGWVAEVCNGATPSQSREDYWEDGVIPWVSSGEVNEKIVAAPTALISEQAVRDTSLRKIPPGSVLVGMIGQGRTRGMSAILGIEACINQNAAAILPGPQLDSEYLYYTLSHAYEPIRQIGRGGQQGALNCELIRSIRILLPPIEEQRHITRHLNKQTRRITELVQLLSLHECMLRDYRTALISAGVTGQIDVRGEVE
jgi:type I restriction enzyme S subunit